MNINDKSILYLPLRRLLYLIFFFFLVSCGSINTEGEKRGYESLRELVNGRKFEVEHQWALPMAGDRINLMDNPNFIRFTGDSVDIFLPYFGVRQSGVNYGSRDGGISYEGLAENLVISENPEKENITIRFEGDEANENLQFYLILFSNWNARTSVTSSQRSSITYQGAIKQTSDDQ